MLARASIHSRKFPRLPLSIRWGGGFATGFLVRFSSNDPDELCKSCVSHLILFALKTAFMLSLQHFFLLLLFHFWFPVAVTRFYDDLIIFLRHTCHNLLPWFSANMQINTQHWISLSTVDIKREEESGNLGDEKERQRQKTREFEKEWKSGEKGGNGESARRKKKKSKVVPNKMGMELFPNSPFFRDQISQMDFSVERTYCEFNEQSTLHDLATNDF